MEDLSPHEAGVGEGRLVAVVVLEVLAEDAKDLGDESGRLLAQLRLEHLDEPRDGDVDVGELRFLGVIQWGRGNSQQRFCNCLNAIKSYVL